MNKLTAALTLLSTMTVSIIFGQTIQGSTQRNNVVGVYLTSEEFKTSVLTDSICTDNENNKLKMGCVGSIYGNIGGKIKLKESGIKRTYNYKSVFGLLYNGNKYRLQKRVSGSYVIKGVFMVIEANGLIIYSQKDPDVHNLTRYFYSKELNGKIKLLRLKNLKKDFPDKTRFLNQANEYRWKLEEKSENGDLVINVLWNKYAY